MSEFTLQWDWDDGASATVQREHALTLARLRISAAGQAITLVHEPSTRKFREHITVPLYPLAEWIAFNWWSLLADARPGTQISQLRGAYRNGVGDARSAWHTRSRRHVLRAAGDGFYWPDVMFVSEGRETRVIWMPDKNAPRGGCYVGRGNVLVDGSSFRENLSSFLDAVTARLLAGGVTGTPLQDEWAAVRRAGPDEEAFCVAAARLGLDPFSTAAGYAPAIIEAGRRLPASLVDDFFNSVGPGRVIDQLDWVERARKLASAGTRDATREASLAELREMCADLGQRFNTWSAPENPWHLGYEGAERVRAWSGLADTDPFDPASLVSYRSEPVPYLDRGLVGFGARAGNHGTLVAARDLTARPRRFLLARALWHLICDDEPEFIISAAHTHRQHAARGFALELLAPARGIATLLADPLHLVSSEDVELISDSYGVGTIVVEHQLDNRMLAPDFR